MTETAKNLRTNANNAQSSLAKEIPRQLEDMKERFSEVRDQARYYTDEVTHAVEKHPIYALAGAAAVGFLIGAIFARR